jgi:aminoglycoside phosphotransferase (APT) family kinase protein
VKLDVRFIVPAAGGSTILLAGEGELAGDGELPSAVLEGAEAVAAIIPVDAFLRDEWRLSAPVLETHPKWRGVADGEPIPTLVLTEPAPAGWAPPDGMAFGGRPANIDALPESIRPRAKELLDELRAGSPPPPLRPRWARRGWYERASSWMRLAAASAGRPLAGEPRPFMLRGISALLRAPTDGPDLFLKAVFPPFHAEPVLTRLLAEWFPSAVPSVVAVEAEQGWLLVEDVGSRWVVDEPEAVRPDALRRGAETLVAIQRSIASDPAARSELLAAGAPHRPLARLHADVAAAIAPDGSAVEGGLEPERARRVLDALAASIERVAAIGLPDAVVHGDFHSGNAAVAGDTIRIIDWSDAAIASPAVDYVTWIGWSAGKPEEIAAATDGWVGAWSSVVDAEALRAAIDDVTIVGAAYQLVSYDGIRRALEPATQYTMVGGGEHFLRELEAILDRRAAVVGT